VDADLISLSRMAHTGPARRLRPEPDLQHYPVDGSNAVQPEFLFREAPDTITVHQVNLDATTEFALRRVEIDRSGKSYAHLGVAAAGRDGSATVLRVPIEDIVHVAAALGLAGAALREREQEWRNASLNRQIAR